MQTNYVEGNDTLVVLVTGNEENQDLVHAFSYSFVSKMIPSFIFLLLLCFDPL